MFGIGFPELIVILVLIVIVVGPEQLPEVMSKGMSFVKEARRHLSEIKETVDQQTASIKEPIDNIRDEIREGVAAANRTDDEQGKKTEGGST